MIAVSLFRFLQSQRQVAEFLELQLRSCQNLQRYQFDFENSRQRELGRVCWQVPFGTANIPKLSTTVAPTVGRAREVMQKVVGGRVGTRDDFSPLVVALERVFSFRRLLTSRSYVGDRRGSMEIHADRGVFLEIGLGSWSRNFS